MARLAVPPLESSTFFIDDPLTRHSVLGPRQIEVRCVYLEDLLGKISACVCVFLTHSFSFITYMSSLPFACKLKRFKLMMITKC